MEPTPRRFTDEILSDEMAAILRSKTPAERMAIVDEFWIFFRTAIRANLARQHPDWTDEELDGTTARRMSRGAF
jgi:hypothetical protein